MLVNDENFSDACDRDDVNSLSYCIPSVHVEKNAKYLMNNYVNGFNDEGSNLARVYRRATSSKLGYYTFQGEG